LVKGFSFDLTLKEEKEIKAKLGERASEDSKFRKVYYTSPVGITQFIFVISR